MRFNIYIILLLISALSLLFPHNLYADTKIYEEAIEENELRYAPHNYDLNCCTIGNEAPSAGFDWYFSNPKSAIEFEFIDKFHNFEYDPYGEKDKFDGLQPRIIFSIPLSSPIHNSKLKTDNDEEIENSIENIEIYDRILRDKK